MSSSMVLFSIPILMIVVMIVKEKWGYLFNWSFFFGYRKEEVILEAPSKVNAVRINFIIETRSFKTDEISEKSYTKTILLEDWEYFYSVCGKMSQGLLVKLTPSIPQIEDFENIHLGKKYHLFFFDEGLNDEMNAEVKIGLFVKKVKVKNVA